MPSDLTLKCPVRLAPTAQVDQSVRFLLTDAQLAGVEEIRHVIVESGVIIRAEPAWVMVMTPLVMALAPILAVRVASPVVRALLMTE